jgi:hypothetical protein
MNIRADLKQIDIDLEAAEDQVSQCRDRYDKIFRPIGLIMREIQSSSYFESVSIYKEGAAVRYGYSCRGCEGSENFTIPWSILEAPDPVEAANQFMAERAARRKREELATKQAEIIRLQNELNGT